MSEKKTNIDVGDKVVESTKLAKSSNKQIDFVPKTKLKNLKKKPAVIPLPIKNKQMDIARQSKKTIQKNTAQTTPKTEPQKINLPKEKIGHIALMPNNIEPDITKPNLEILMTPEATAGPLKVKSKLAKNKKGIKSRLPFLLYSLAGIILLIGLGLTLKQYLINRDNTKKALHYIALANAGKPSPAPATVKPSANDIANYTVAPNMPRYLIIPSLNVFARVRSVGITSSGAIGTPTNVYDTAWFNQSALPGQPGASLIDGHVSSWTTNGVFYGIKNLKSGDLVKVQRGDGVVFTFDVVKSQIYPYNNVDISSALTPIVPGVPGLNLITCTGKVISGTNEFNERIVVYTKLVSQT